MVEGLLDVVGLTPVPTLVYRYRNHLISLTAAAANQTDSAPALRTFEWLQRALLADGGVAYRALSGWT